MCNNKVKVKESSIPGAGRGVFATRRIKKGLLIERSPVLALSPKERTKINETALRDYSFPWGNSCCICFGLGSLLNHSTTPNAYARPDFKNKCILIIALDVIEPGSEILTDYSSKY